MPATHLHVNYLPARLVIGHRWYILYYQFNPITRKKERFRETYDLNRISDLKEREKKALQHIENINAKLPFGFPFEKELAKIPLNENIVTAVAIGEKLMSASDRDKTRKTARSMCNIFREYLDKENLSDMRIGEFTKIDARRFLDYGLFEREIANRTYNNYIERMRTLFYELSEREYVSINPFVGFKKRKVVGKKRRGFSDKERDIMSIEIAKGKNKWLHLGVLLQYHCFIRPIELRRLRFSMIDLEAGLIRMPGEVTKNKDIGIVTIPKTLIRTLKDFNLDKYNRNFLVFGSGLKPHPDKPCRHDHLYELHREVLKRLKKNGTFPSIEGLTFYSWKDTGAYALFKAKVNMLEIMRQLRHKSLSTTQRYCQSLYVVNQEIRDLDNELPT